MPLYGEEKREYQRQWLKSRRDEWINSQGGKCVKCNSTQFLEIDHISRVDKSVKIGMLWSRRKDLREAELQKCQVLCSSCHLLKTVSEIKSAAPHGTNAKYGRGCRCEPCRSDHARAAREYRNRIARERV